MSSIAEGAPVIVGKELRAELIRLGLIRPADGTVRRAWFDAPTLTLDRGLRGHHQKEVTTNEK